MLRLNLRSVFLHLRSAELALRGICYLDSRSHSRIHAVLDSVSDLFSKTRLCLELWPIFGWALFVLRHKCNRNLLPFLAGYQLTGKGCIGAFPNRRLESSNHPIW